VADFLSIVEAARIRAFVLQLTRKARWYDILPRVHATIKAFPGVPVWVN
jgi:hypothetical protein